MVDIFKTYIRFKTLGKVCLELTTLSVAVAVMIYIKINMPLLCTKYDNKLPHGACNNYVTETVGSTLSSQLISPSPTPLAVPKVLSSEDALILHYLQRVRPLAIIAIVLVAIDILLNVVTTALLIGKDDAGRIALYEGNWFIILIMISIFFDMNQVVNVIFLFIVSWPVKNGVTSSDPAR